MNGTETQTPQDGKPKPYPIAWDTAIVQQHPQMETITIAISKKIREKKDEKTGEYVPRPEFTLVKGDVVNVVLMSDSTFEIEKISPKKV